MRDSMSENKTGIYINGKEQALEILKLLSHDERTRILNSINLKNPSLASELRQNSMSSRDMQEYSTSDFKKIFNLVKPEILGLALKQTSMIFQKKILKMAPRSYAENAFKTLMIDIPPSKAETVTRAKKLVVSELAKISQ